MRRNRRALTLFVLMLLASVLFLGSRRRIARSGPECPTPTVSFSSSPISACANDPITLTWQSSDPRATVTIDGLGSGYPANGSLYVTSGQRIFSGRAISGCGGGPVAGLTVPPPPAPSGMIDAPLSTNEGASVTVSVSLVEGTSWSVESSLGNPISPSSGTASTNIRYTATRSGTDTLTLFTSGKCGTRTSRSTSIGITASQPVPPPPPPTTGSLRCCDGTLSPTCTSCAHKQGCCSSHGGVCGC